VHSVGLLYPIKQCSVRTLSWLLIISGPKQEDMSSVDKDCHTVRVEPGRASEIHTALSAFSPGFHNFTIFFSFAKHSVTRGTFFGVYLPHLFVSFSFKRKPKCSNITFCTDMSYSLSRFIIIIIIIFINCNWVVTRWQWLFNTKHEIGLVLNLRREGYVRSM
jgi:hypothetical protein